jgi:hypothetical protein
MPLISKDFLKSIYFVAIESIINDLSEEEKKKVPSFDEFINSLVITKKKIKIKKNMLPRGEGTRHSYIERKSSYTTSDARPRCLARVRNDRWGGQCTNSVHESSRNNLCLRHEKTLEKKKQLDYGYITEKRCNNRSGGDSRPWKNTEEEEYNLIGVLKQ